VRLDVPLCSVLTSRAGGKDNTGRPSQTTIQSNGSISETVRNRTHVHKSFGLEWPILWPPRILTFLPGTLCINTRQEYLWCNLSDFQHSEKRVLRQLVFPMYKCWSETWRFWKRMRRYTIKSWYNITITMPRRCVIVGVPKSPSKNKTFSLLMFGISQYL
jgi:hypothetical protein